MNNNIRSEDEYSIDSSEEDDSSDDNTDLGEEYSDILSDSGSNSRFFEQETVEEQENKSNIRSKTNSPVAI